MKVLDIQADEAEKMYHKKKKPNDHTGFSSKCYRHLVIIHISILVIPPLLTEFQYIHVLV